MSKITVKFEKPMFPSQVFFNFHAIVNGKNIGCVYDNKERWLFIANYHTGVETVRLSARNKTELKAAIRNHYSN